MEKEKISKSLDLLLKNKFGCSDEKLSMMKKDRFLSSEICFSAANLLELFLEIEKEFGVSFSRDEILNIQFDNYTELVECINKKQGGK